MDEMRAPAPELVTPRQAAALVGVSESTVRRWCDRALVRTGRTQGRHRRIEIGALLAFAREAGLPATERSAAGRGGRLAPPDELRRRLMHGLLDGDAPGVRAVLTGWLEGGRAIDALCDEVVAPAMHEIGVQWARGRLEIYEEHRATQILLDALASLRGYLPNPEATSPVAICAALSEDPYGVGPLMTALVAQAEGYAPVLLGPDTPAEAVATAARALGARLVCVSIGACPDLEQVCEGLAKLSRLAVETDAAVAIGGRALDAALAARLSPGFSGRTMGDLARFARAERTRSPRRAASKRARVAPTKEVGR